MSIVSNVQKGLLSVYLLFLNYVYTYIVNVLITIRMLVFFVQISVTLRKEIAIVLYENVLYA